MGEREYKFNFNFLKASLWATLILALLKVSGTMDIATIWVLMPAIIAAGLVFLSFFLIGVIVVFLVVNRSIDQDENIEEDEKYEEKS